MRIALLRCQEKSHTIRLTRTASSMMFCLSALHTQIVTIFLVPHEILLFRHKVFREYVKTAVGPDFIHTLPSILILTAAIIFLWKNPPSSVRLLNTVTTCVYKGFQVLISWLTISIFLWLWLILQRILYCSVWYHWSYESESRDIFYLWWERVWSSYYPVREQPVMSTSFISWMIAMLLAVIMLGCAIVTDRVQTFIKEPLVKIRKGLTVVVAYVWQRMKWKEMQETFISSEANVAVDGSEGSSVCDDSPSEMSVDTNSLARGDVHPISYGTNWMPQPNFSMFKEAQRKISMKSFHTVAGVNEIQDPEQFLAKQLRHRRSCHTVIPSNSSDQSSGC